METKIRRIIRTKKNDFQKNYFILFLMIFFLTTIIFITNTLPSRPYEVPPNIYNVPIITDILSEDHPFRPQLKRKVKYIVIHETANPKAGSNAKSHNIYIHKNREREVSWHYSVDDKEIYNHIPDNEVAWHAGDKLTIDGGNANGIGIEMCVNVDGDFEKTKLNTAKLVAFLLKTHNLSINNVKQHADFYNKNCPANLRVADNWDQFLNLIKTQMEENN